MHESPSRPPKPRLFNRRSSVPVLPATITLDGEGDSIGSLSGTESANTPPRSCRPPPVKKARTSSTTSPDVYTEAIDALGESSDNLGALAACLSDHLSSVGMRDLISAMRGVSDLNPGVKSIPHGAARLLDRMRRCGVPVPLSTPPLTLEEKDTAAAYGSHASCDANAKFLRKEIGDFVQKGFWMVLPFSTVRKDPNLRLSPAGLVPQRDRRDRLIIDYTWSGVNQATQRLAPDSMQYGRALQRVLQRIYDADIKHGPVHMLKVDIADGFYRVWLSVCGVMKLGVALPKKEGEEQLIAFPLVLPMGWVESPPHFCAVTETVADLANESLRKGDQIDDWHRLEVAADSAPPSYATATAEVPMTHNRPHRHARPLSYIDLFVDDFLALAAGPPRTRNRVRRALLSSLDTVLRPLSSGDRSSRAEPASVKKLLKGDGAWATQKILLGWLIDSIEGTIALPPHRCTRLHEILAEVHGRDRVPLRQWQKLLGELRSMMLALPGAEGLFSHLQSALLSAGGGWVRLTKPIRDDLND